MAEKAKATIKKVAGKLKKASKTKKNWRVIALSGFRNLVLFMFLIFKN